MDKDENIVTMSSLSILYMIHIEDSAMEGIKDNCSCVCHCDTMSLKRTTNIKLKLYY